MLSELNLKAASSQLRFAPTCKSDAPALTSPTMARVSRNRTVSSFSNRFGARKIATPARAWDCRSLAKSPSCTRDRSRSARLRVEGPHSALSYPRSKSLAPPRSSSVLEIHGDSANVCVGKVGQAAVDDVRHRSAGHEAMDLACLQKEDQLIDGPLEDSRLGAAAYIRRIPAFHLPPRQLPLAVDSAHTVARRMTCGAMAKCLHQISTSVPRLILFQPRLERFGLEKESAPDAQYAPKVERKRKVVRGHSVFRWRLRPHVGPQGLCIFIGYL